MTSCRFPAPHGRLVNRLRPGLPSERGGGTLCVNHKTRRAARAFSLTQREGPGGLAVAMPISGGNTCTL